MPPANDIRRQKYAEWLQANPDHPRYNEVYQNYQKLVTPTTGQNVGKELVGAGETAATIATGIPAQLYGNIKGVGSDLLNLYKYYQRPDTPTFASALKGESKIPDFGGEQIATETAEGLTYMPRTEEGQRNIEAIGEAVQESGIEGIAPQYAGITRGALRPRIGVTSTKNIKNPFTGKDVKVPSSVGTKNVVEKFVKPRVYEDITEGKVLKDQARRNFKDAKDSGVLYKSDELYKLSDELKDTLRETGIDPETTWGKQATDAINKLESRAGIGKTSLEDLLFVDDLFDDIYNVNQPKSKTVSIALKDKLDDFIVNSQESQFLGGDKKGIAFQKKGQQLWGKAKKTETINEMIDRASEDSSINFGNAEFETAIRREFRKLRRNPKKFNYFNAEEQQLIREFIKGQPLQTFFRALSKFDIAKGSPGPIIASTLAGAGAGLGSTSALMGLGVAGGLAGAGRVGAIGKNVAATSQLMDVLRQIQLGSPKGGSILQPGLAVQNIPTGLLGVAPGLDIEPSQ